MRQKEIKKQIGESNKGRKFTDEWRNKIGKANEGRIISKETKLKMSKARKGKTFEEFYGKEKAIELKEEISKRMLKENNPAWLGGKSFEPYDESFNEKFKRRIRKRDNQICMLCGIHREKLKRALTVHHVNYDKKLTIPQNCLSLCHLCHMKTNTNRKHWINFFQDLLTEKYGYEYNESREIVLSIKPTKMINYG